MRIALAQINPTVGDIDGNVSIIRRYIKQAREQQADVVVFGELAVTGYPPKDLLLKPQFIDDNLAALQTVATDVIGIDVILGYADRNAASVGRPLHNAVAVLRDGQVVSRHYKTLLPTYDVFDESRYFEPGPIDLRNQVVRVCGRPVGLSICEDLWNDERLIARRMYHHNPLADLSAAGAKLMINCSASPFVVGKQKFRIELFGAQVRQFATPLVYVNQVGGNDELVFDGCSMVFDSHGRVIAQAAAFEEQLLVVEVPEAEEGATASQSHAVPPADAPERSQNSVELSTSTAPPAEMVSQTLPQDQICVVEENNSEGTIISADDLRDIHSALVLGLRDYCRKCGFKKVVLGLSGGIDSALVCALAVAAVGADKVTGVAMPSRYSSDHSVADARALAHNLGVRLHIVPIEPAHAAVQAMLDAPFGGKISDLTEENLQARTRGNVLMSFSNETGALLLTTGNKSEVAVGYCTLYGDMCGGLAVISDVPKTTVWALSRWINKTAGKVLIPTNSIEKVPSAELRPGQTDQDSLPPYDVLDAIIFRLIEEDKSLKEIVADGYDPATVLRVTRLIDRSEYKRRQSAPGIKVTSRAFGFGRRMPIAQNYRQTVPDS